MKTQYIKDLVAGKSGTVIGIISAMGEITTGTKKDGTTFTNQRAKVSDNSSTVTLQLWGDQCGLFKNDDIYLFEEYFVTEYKGAREITKGKFGKTTASRASDLLPKPDTLDAFETSTPASVATNEDIDQRIGRASKVTKAYIKVLKDEGCESPDGCSAVWNTEMMRK